MGSLEALRERNRLRRIGHIAAAVLLVPGLAACSGHKSSSSTTTATTPIVTGPSILTGEARRVTFAQARKAIRQLYASYPEIQNFVYKDVVYTPATRDKVLAVCKQGGPTSNARDRETSRVFGCAPLIFFFYEFGRQKSVPQSIEVARKLFWYAAEIPGPYAALPPLTDLLQGWGIR